MVLVPEYLIHRQKRTRLVDEVHRSCSARHWSCCAPSGHVLYFVSGGISQCYNEFYLLYHKVCGFL